MQTQQKLGPVFLDLAATEMTDDEAKQLQHHYTGGVILFGRNFRSVTQLQKLIESIRSVRQDILIAVDQEGGRVQRFRDGFTRLPPLQLLGKLAQKDYGQALDLTYRCGWVMASELRALGVDLSFAPVLDADDDFSDVIGDRSFGKSIETVAGLGRIYIKAMKDAGMPATAKHFPGHGGTKADSHISEAVDERPMSVLQAEDLRPFKELLGDCAAVMPAHVVFPMVDSAPVGFSRVWLQDILRSQLQFRGVIFSDDLSMRAAAAAGSYSQRALAALSAGCDAVLICNQPQAAVEVLDFLQAQAWPVGDRLTKLRSLLSRPFSCLTDLQQDQYWSASQQAIARLMANV